METTDLLEISNLETAGTLSPIWRPNLDGGGASHNGRKDQLTTHGIFRDALAAREIRLNCRQMEFACLKNCRFQTVYTTHGYNDSVHALKDIF